MQELQKQKQKKLQDTIKAMKIRKGTGKKLEKLLEKQGRRGAQRQK